MKPLPIGIQTFRKLVEGNYLYVDKTKKIYSLIENASGSYFLSRPRRFGKSLTLSVLDEIFSANKELFKGLYIYDSPWEWKKYPVLRFDFSKQKAKNKEELIQFLFEELEDNSKRHEISLERTNYVAQFQELITQLGNKGGVVILIDEYDKPIIDHIENEEIALEMREIMKGFFTVLKGSDPYIRFLLLTGVSKFSKAGVFSNLNHLHDITLEDAFSDLIGITEDELETNFKEYIQVLGLKENLDYPSTLTKIRDWYNGYRFSPDGKSVYNPFSTLLLFTQFRFEHHWFETEEVFTNIEYDLQIHQEKYYQTIFYLLFNLLGYYIQTEVKTNRGRIDAVVECRSIYIFEFKINGSREEALNQIKEKKYYERYVSKGKKIYLLGVEFRDRNIGEYLVELLPMSDMT